MSHVRPHSFRRYYQPYAEPLEERRLLAADVLINEIMYHQLGDNTGLEFIELLNNGDESADLTGWSFASGVDYAFPAISLEAGSYLVVAANLEAFAEAYPSVSNVVGDWTGRLANRGEGVTLVDSSGLQVDRVRYADGGDWASRFLGPDDNGQRGWHWLAPHDGDGKSLELMNPNLTNDFGHNWSASVPEGGTPGTENSVRTDNVAPLVVDLAHAPLIPTSSDVVTISMSVVDEDLDTVVATLSYRRDGDTSFETVAMSHTGNLFEAVIPEQQDGTVIEFFVTVVDSLGSSRVVPTYESDIPSRTANRLYQVLDDAATVVDWNPDSQPITYLVMTDAERIILADIGNGPLLEAQSDAQMNGTFVRIDGNGEDIRDNVGIRNRGGASRVGPPNNYRIGFPHDNSFLGQAELNLNSRFTHAQIIGSAIYRLAGMAAAEGQPVQVRVNGFDLADPGGPNMFGSYVQMEVISGSFPDKYFPNDRRGNLYRVIESGTETGDLRFEGTNPSAYQDTYSKRTNEEEGDWTDLIDLVNVLNNTPEENFVDEVNRVANVDQWLRYLALDALLGNLETGLNVGRGDNYWLYRGIEDTRFQLIPHDLDTILGVGRAGQPNASIFGYALTPGLERLLTHEEFVPRYYQAFVDLIEDVYNPETLFPLMDQLIGYVSEVELADMKQYVLDRTQGVLRQLPTEFSIVPPALPFVDGYYRTTFPSVALEGTVNILETQSVTVNGQVVDLSSTTAQWSVSIDGTGSTESLIPAGSTWKYIDDGSDLGAGWRSTSFDTSLWPSGPSPLGYGEGDEATVVSSGSNPFLKNITTYFRHEFEIADESQILDLSMRLERDDGAVVYLNNQEIVRSNLPAGNIDFQTVADSWIGGGLEGQLLSFSIDPNLLVDGNNVLAVEIHQVSSIDDDLSFDLTLDATVGTQTGGISLNPGINRIEVAAFAGPSGSGKIVNRDYIDIWYDGAAGIDEGVCNNVSQFGTLAPTNIVGGTLDTDTFLAPCGPAYRVTGPVVIPQGVTLTVLPGTTIFFEAQAGLTFDGGQLIAEGSEFDPIRFTRAPDLVGSWEGIQFVNSTADNRISHAILEYATTEQGLVGLTSSRLEISDATFDHAELIRIKTIDSSLVVRNSMFTDIFKPGAVPSDNGSEHINGSGILDGGQLLLEGNHFGTTPGHNDSVDFDSAELPGPIPIIRNNVFAGSGDDALDLESDAYVEGNTFFNVRKDQFNISTGDANAISAGAGRTYYVYRNKFHNVDHAVQVKDEAFLIFEHNTVDTVHISPIYFDLEDRSPGKGATVDASIFWNTPVTFGAADQAQQLSVTNSIVGPDALDLGVGNFQANPRLTDPANGDFSLAPGSPARGIAFDAMDLGGEVPAAVWIAGEPAAVTGRTSALLSVGGPGINQYRYRLDDGPWSDPLELDVPIALSNLEDGDHEVEVIGRTTAGVWQTDLEAARVRWTIDTTRTHLYLNEILASNSSFQQFGEAADLIELFNDSETTIDLTGMSITDDPAQPDKFIFPSGTLIEPGGYLVVLATDSAGDGLRLGFRLARDGESVHLYDTVASGGELLDSVAFGIQITDFSIGRIGADREWKLSEPSFGESNRETALGSPSSVRINEWLAKSDVRFTGDFIELYNSGSQPVSLAGLYLTDDPIGQPDRHQIAPLSFISGSGFEVFDPNGNPENGANELTFGVAADGEMLALLDADLRPIDQVFVLPQTIDRSQGRTPDGSDTISYPDLATPGNPNPVNITETTTLFDFEGVWAYDQSGTNLGTAWRANDFDDAQWPVGAGPLGVANGEIVIPLNTPLNTGIVTHYFRSEFEIDVDSLADAGTIFELQTLIDDGAIIYINNVEVLRLGLPEGEITFDSTANRGIFLATIEGPFTIPTDILVPGNNVIAAEVHQVSKNNSDVVFAASVTAATTFTDEISTRVIQLRDGLRISELMYHPAGDKDAEYIELTNISSGTLNLDGVSIAGGVDGVLSAVQLEPGEHVVISPDESVFRSTYGDSARVVGVYDGNLSNGGEELILRLPAPFDGPFDGAILQFTYSDDWQPSTDGEGYSLEIIDVDAPIKSWTTAAGWKRSADIGGSPGRDDGALLGDLNSDNVVDGLDVDALSAAISSQSTDLVFDLNNDNAIDIDDQTFMIEDILGTRSGDANLDGKVSFLDFLVLATNYGKPSAAVWSDGDFNADGKANFLDFLLLATNYGFQR